MVQEKQKQQIRVFKKGYEDLNLEKVLVDKICINEVEKQLKDIKLKRMVSAPAGMRWKRSGYDTLCDTGRLNSSYFLESYLLIDQKKSTLPSSIRSFIEPIVVRSIRKTIEERSIIVEEGMSFATDFSEGLPYAMILSFDTKENKIILKHSEGKSFRTEELNFDEVMEEFRNGRYLKL